MNVYYIIYWSGFAVSAAIELKSEIKILTRLMGPWGRNLKRCGIRQGLFLDLAWETDSRNKASLIDYILQSAFRMIFSSVFSWLSVAFNAFAEERFRQQTGGRLKLEPSENLNKLFYEDLPSRDAIRLFEVVCPDLGIGRYSHGETDDISEIKKLAGTDWKE